MAKADLEEKLGLCGLREANRRHHPTENGFRTRKNPAIYCFQQGLTVSAFFDRRFFHPWIGNLEGKGIFEVRASIDLSEIVSAHFSVNMDYNRVYCKAREARTAKSFSGYLDFRPDAPYFINGKVYARVAVPPYSICASTGTLSQVVPMIEALKQCRALIEEDYRSSKSPKQ